MSPRSEGERGLVEQEIETWARQNIAYPDLKLHGPCTKVVLRHVNLERKPQGDVASWPVKLEEGAEDEGLTPLLHKIADTAQGDADDLSQGLQTYALFAYYAGDKGYSPRKYFRVAPSDVEVQRDLSPSEPATERGLVAQTQRHLEAVMRTSTVATGHIISTMQGEMRRLAELNERFSKQQIDFLVLMQDMLDTSHHRRLDERGEEAKLALQESALAQLKPILPVILNRLAGKQILPEENRSLMLMSALLENLSEDQQRAFYDNLTHAQRLAFAEVLHEYEKGREKYWATEMKVDLGAKSGLPPASTAPSSPPDDVLSPASEASAHPRSLSLRERLALPAKPPSDPHIRTLESDAQAFASRFRDMLSPTHRDRGDKP